jgi:L-lysine exporter family protein LysE/ArgO
VSDAILISLGVSGFGVLVQRFPIIEQIARFGGATFLTVYGIMNLYSAYTKSHSLNPEGSTPESALKIALLCLGFTWLNPHVYLDTVVLLGSISTQFSDNIDAFTLGAISASFVFFYALGYGSRVLIPLFKKPRAWKVFEAIIGLIMIILAIGLLW